MAARQSPAASAASDAARTRACGADRRGAPRPSPRTVARPARSPPAPPRARPHRSRRTPRPVCRGGSGGTAESRRTAYRARWGIRCEARSRVLRGAATRGWTTRWRGRRSRWRSRRAAGTPRWRELRDIAVAGSPRREAGAGRGLFRRPALRLSLWLGSPRRSIVPRRTRERRRARPMPLRDSPGALYASTRPPP